MSNAPKKCCCQSTGEMIAKKSHEVAENVQETAKKTVNFVADKIEKAAHVVKDKTSEALRE